jgi:WD40 repeat protein
VGGIHLSLKDELEQSFSSRRPAGIPARDYGGNKHLDAETTAAENEVASWPLRAFHLKRHYRGVILSGGCRMSSAPISRFRRVRKPLLAVLAVLFCLATAAGLGTWWLWPPQPYVVLPGSDSISDSNAANHILIVGDVPSGTVVLGGVSRVEFSRDGALVAGIRDDKILVWETAGGQLRCILPSDASVTALLFSPDGRQLAARGERLKLYDLVTGDERPLNLDRPDVTYAIFSPDGKTLLVMDGDATVSLVNPATGAQWFLPLKPPGVLRLRPGHANDWRTEPRSRACRFSPDGRWLACEEVGTVRVFDIAARAEQATYPGTLGQLAFSPDGETWAVAAGNDVRLCAAPSGEERALLRGHTSPVAFLAWSPDGKRLASVAGDEIKLWDAGSSQELATLSPGRATSGCRFSPDGRFLCLADSGFDRQHGTFFAPGEIVPLWDLRANPPRHVVSVGSEKIVSPDDRVVAKVGEPDVPVQPWTIARRLATSTWEVGAGNDYPAFTPDGKLVVLAGHTTLVRGKLGTWLARGAGDGNGYQYKWVDVDTWQARAVLDTDAPGVFSPDYRLLATGGRDKPVQLWRVPPRHPLGPSLVLLGLIGVLAVALVLRIRRRPRGVANGESSTSSV